MRMRKQNTTTTKEKKKKMKMNKGGCLAMIERRRTDRSEQVRPYDVIFSPNIEITLSPFLFNLLDFTVQRKISKLNRATQSIIDSTEDSCEQLDALKNLSSLIEADPRLSDHLCSKVFPYLLKFLQDEKSFEFQYYSACVLEIVLSSDIGLEFKDQAIPFLVKLIPSPDIFVQAQALLTLTKIANKFPYSCNAMIKNGALDHLESLLTNECNDFDSLKHGGQLLTTFCRVKPHLAPDKLGKAVSIISTAIKQNSRPVLLQVCLALSILSDRRLVEIGTEVKRLIDLIDYSDQQIVFCALRTIGNYVRWASGEEIQLMFRSSFLLTNLGKLLCHGYKIVRKEACWIIANITAIANSSQIQEVVGLGLIDMLVRVVREDEFEVKEFAVCAISNVCSGSEKIQFECIKHKYFPLLDKIRHCSRNDPPTVTLCSIFLELNDTYRIKTSSEILKPVFLPADEEGGSSTRAHMTTGATANLVSSSTQYAQQTEYATRKKQLRRRKKLSCAASPPELPLDPLTDLRGDLGGYEVLVESSMKDLDSNFFSGLNKLEKAKKLPTIASLSIHSAEDLDSKKHKKARSSTRKAKSSKNCRTPRNISERGKELRKRCDYLQTTY